MTEETQAELMEIYQAITEILLNSEELNQTTLDALQRTLWELEDILDIN